MSTPGPTERLFERRTIPAAQMSVADWSAAENAKIKKRSIFMRGRKTSVSLEEPFWQGLRSIAKLRRMPVATLVVECKDKDPRNLSSSLRMLVLDHYQNGAKA